MTCLRIIIVGCFLVLASCSSESSDIVEPGVIAVSGTLLDSLSMEPLAEVEVFRSGLVRAQDGTLEETWFSQGTSEADGSFRAILGYDATPSTWEFRLSGYHPKQVVFPRDSEQISDELYRAEVRMVPE